MKKILLVMGVLLIGSVFNLTPEVQAAKREHLYQNATAYVGSTTGHGATYGYYNQQYSTVAVKKWENNDPYIPFGTVINLTDAITLDGVNLSKKQFTVTDTGPGAGRSSYWIDVYYGLDTPQNRTNALKFGQNKIVSYTADY